MARLDLVIAGPIWRQLASIHLGPDKRVESLSYVFAYVEPTPEGWRVLIPHTAPVIRFAPDCFELQAAGNVRLHPDVLRGLLISFARTHYPCLINVHDHWFDARATFSAVDDADDRRFDVYVRDQLEPSLGRIAGTKRRPIYNLSLVLGCEGADARLVDTRRAGGPFVPAHSITVIGEQRLRVPLRHECFTHTDEPRLSRHRDFIDAQERAALAELRVALVGCGGIGSILGELLARLGIGNVTLIDDETLDETNLNRWQGARPSMVGRAKAQLLARRLRQMSPGVRVRALARSVFDRSVMPDLATADVIFGAVDADEPRFFLNALAIQYCVPYFDAGVLVTNAGGAIDFRTRIFAVLPGTSACADCTQFMLYDRARAREQFFDAATTSERRRAGYVSAQIAVAAPSVYPLNQRAAGLLLTEFLNWVCGWRPAATVVSESWERGKIERADRQNFPEGPDAECPICSSYAGIGSSGRLPRPAKFRLRREIATTAVTPS